MASNASLIASSKIHLKLSQNSSVCPILSVAKCANSCNTTKNNVNSYQKEKDITQRQIDEILDKISKSGYDSLTKEEKEFLFKAGK